MTSKSSAADNTTSRDLRQQESSGNTRTMSISSVTKSTIKRKLNFPEDEKKNVVATTTFTSIGEEPSFESSENKDYDPEFKIPPLTNQTSTTKDYPVSFVDTIIQRQQRIAAGDLEYLDDDLESSNQTHPIPDHIFDTFDKVSLGEKNTSENVFFNLPAGAPDLDASSVLSFESGLERSTVLPNPALSDETWL